MSFVGTSAESETSTIANPLNILEGKSPGPSQVIRAKPGAILAEYLRNIPRTSHNQDPSHQLKKRSQHW
jgi:hypothetical protein